MKPDKRTDRTRGGDDLSEVTKAPSAPPAGDARGDPQKQRKNREHLRVDEDHATPDMKKGHRGTFP